MRIKMNIIGIGYNTVHERDFEIKRPGGYGDYLLLVMKTPSFHVLEDRKQIYPAHCAVLYDQTTPQDYGAAEDTYVDDWIHFSMEPEELLWWEGNHIRFNTIIRMTDSDIISMLIRQMSLEYYSADPSKESTLRLYMQLLSNKIMDLSERDESGMQRSLYDQLVQLRSDIYNRPAVSRTVEQTAAELSISASYLQHMYKKLFTVTLMNDVIHSRIENSKKLQTGTDFTVQKIAECCGYEYDVYFMRQFKKETGMTPGEYRRTELSGK